MTTIATSPIRATADIPDRVDLGQGFFYVLTGDTVGLWHSDGSEAIQLGLRRQGTSGKPAATIARDMLGA